LLRRLLFIVVQLRRTLLLHHGYTMLPISEADPRGAIGAIGPPKILRK